jgi:hypothetical protein
MTIPKSWLTVGGWGRKKLALLTAFRGSLKDSGLGGPPITFPTAMELLNLSGENSNYQERVFAHFLFLMISQHRNILYCFFCLLFVATTNH